MAQDPNRQGIGAFGPASTTPATPAPRGGGVGAFGAPAPDPLAQSLSARPPDRTARLRQLQERTGLPIELLDQNFDDFDKRDRGERYNVEALRRRSPVLATWLEQHGDVAAVAADDLHNLERVSKGIDFLGKLAQGWESLEAMGGSFLEVVGEASGFEPFRQWGREVRVRNTQEAATYGGSLSFRDVHTPRDFVKWLGEGFAQNTPQLAVSAGGVWGGAELGGAIGSLFGGAGALPGAVIGGVIGAIPAFVLGVGETQQQLKEIDPEATAPGTVFLGGSAVAALDTVVPAKLGSKLVQIFGFKAAEQIAQRTLLTAVKPKFLRGTLREGVTDFALEGLTEAMQSAIQAVTAAEGTGTAVDWTRTAQDMLEEGLLGGAVGGVMGAGAHVASFRGQQRAFAAAQQNRAAWEAIAAAAKDSTTAKRSQETAAQIIQDTGAAHGVDTVHLPIDSFEEYFQRAGVSPDAIADELTGRQGALEDAKTRGLRDLPVPIGAFATKIAGAADQAHFNFFRDELRMVPEQMNLRETKERAKELEAELEAERKSSDTDQRSSAVAIAAAVMQQAVDAGASVREARAWGGLFAARYERRAQTLGVDPLELFTRDPIRITVTDPSGRPIVERPRPDANQGIVDLPPSRGARGESREAAATRSHAHLAALEQLVIENAQRVDPTVDVDQVRRELRLRIDLQQEAQQATLESGRDPGQLLRAIAERGGLWHERSGVYRGELATIRESQTSPDQWGGVKGVFRREGMTPDAMAQSLAQDPEFAWVTDPNVLLDALDVAVRTGTEGARQAQSFLPGSAELGDLGVDLNGKWWTDSWLGEQTDLPVLEDSDSVEPEGSIDTSFDPDEFEQRVRGVVEAASWIEALPPAPQFGDMGAKRVPFPTIPMDVGSEMLSATGGVEALKRAPVESIPIKDIVATQTWFFPATVSGYLETPGEPVQALFIRGKYILADGTHRAVAGWARGDAVVPAHVLDVDESRLPQPPSGTAGPLVVDNPQFIAQEDREAAPVMARFQPASDEELEAFRRAREAARLSTRELAAQEAQEFEQRRPPADRVVRDQELATAPAAWVKGKLRISTRVPAGPHAVPADAPLTTGLETILEAGPDAIARFAAVVREHQLLTKAQRKLPPAKQLEAFVDAAAANIRFLWNHREVKPWRDRARKWYAGANRVAQILAARHGLTDAQAVGVIAVLSPQAEWFTNVDQAFRIADVAMWAARSNPIFTRDLFESYAAQEERAKGDTTRGTEEHIDHIVSSRRRWIGLAWDELPLEGKAVLARQLDEVTNPRTYRTLLPEGQFGAFARRRDGELASTRPQAYDAIASAISVLEDGSPLNISRQLGSAHKVRSFFNNLSDASADAVTIDIHALAAALFQPVARGDNPQLRAMAKPPGINPAGVRGLSALYMTAYRRAAEQISKASGTRVSAREVQSVTWEAIRLVFTPARKQNAEFLVAVAALWSDFQRGTLSLGGVRTRIVALAGGVGSPAWGATPERLARDEGGVPPAYAPRQSGAVPTRPRGARAGAGRSAGRGAARSSGARVGNPERAAATRQRIRLASAQSRARRRSQEFESRVRGSQPRFEPTGEQRDALNVELGALLEQLEAPYVGQGVAFHAHVANGGDVYVDLLMVPNELQGQGIGGQILDAIVSWADTHNLAASLDQSPNPGKKGALQRFYRAHGFIRNGTARYYDASLAGDWVRPSRSERGGDEFYQLEGFYSRVARAVANATQERATGKQWKGIIRNAGVNLDELEAVSIEALEDSRSYSRAEVAKHITDHSIELDTVSLEERPYTDQQLRDLADELYEAELGRRVDEALEHEGGTGAYVEVTDESDDDGEGWSVVMRDNDGSIIQDDLVDDEQQAEDLRNTWEEQIASRREEDVREILAQQLDYGEFEDEALRRLDERTEAERVQYEKYVEPGADAGSYREFFITAPGTELRDGFVALTDAENRFLQVALPSAARKIRSLERREAEQSAEIANIIGDLKDPTYISRGRTPERVAQLQRLIPILEKLLDAQDRSWQEKAWDDGHDDYARIENPVVRIRYNTRTSVDGSTTLFLEEVQPPAQDQFARMPELFQKTWRELAFKWAMRQAAINGYARVAWTSGAMQAKRYNLRQVVERLTYYPQSKQLAGYNVNNNEVIRQYDVEPKDLGKYVGEEVAARLLTVRTWEVAPEYVVRERAGEFELWRNGVRLREFGSLAEAERKAREFAATANFRTREIHELAGEQLEIGGEGLGRLYDRDFPRVVDKIAKKAGAKTTALQVPFGKSEMPIPAALPPGARAEWDRRHHPIDITRLVPGIEITPALRELLTKDQALYQDPPEGELHGAYNPSTRTIRLIAGAADLSTFLEEAGHAFLEELLADAVTVDEGHALRRDALTALRWMGFQGSIEDFRALTVNAKRDMHEKWAAGFQQYLFEGRAPTPELQSLFTQFRDWLVQVYRTITQLKFNGQPIELADDVRGVMARLLASEDAIAAAERVSQVRPLFVDAPTAGVDELTFAAYRKEVESASAEARRQLDAEVMADWRREQNAQWKAEREEVRKQIVHELQREPVFVAQSVIRNGHMPDGSIPSFGDGRAMKLSKDAIVAQFGPEVLKRLPKPWLYTATGGLDPSIVAQMTGFPSGEALIEALIRAPRLESVLEQQTDNAMRDRRGDRLLDGIALKEAAQAAVVDQRRRVIAAELEALTKGMAAGIPRADVMRAQARQAISGVTVRELRPGTYRAAAARASRDAFEAFAKNDRRAAIAAKQRELLALEFHREAVDAQQEVERARRRMEQLDTSTAIRARMGKAGVQDQIDAILERYEFKRVPEKQLRRRESLREYLLSLERQGVPTDHIPDDVIDDARRVNWRELTVEELRGVRDAVEAIAHLGRLKDKLLSAAAKRNLADARNDLATSIRLEAPPGGPRGIEPRLPDEQRVRRWRGGVLGHRTMSSLCFELDGYQFGPLWSYVMRPINEAMSRKAEMMATTTRAFSELLNRHYTGTEQLQFSRKQYLPELGAPQNPRATLSKMARLMVALNYGNATNKQRLRDGYGWTDDQVRAVLSTLDERDWDFVAGVWTLIDGFWPEIAAKMQRVSGNVAERVEPEPFTNKFGRTLSGGYFPLKYEGATDPIPAAQEGATAAELQKNTAYMATTVRRGHEKQRAKANLSRPVRLDMGVVVEHLNEVIHSLALHETIIDVGRLLHADGVVARAIYDTFGDQAYKTMLRTVQHVAVGEQQEYYDVDRWVDHLRRGSQVVGLGLNFVTPIIQLAGFGNVAARLGTLRTMRTVMKVAPRLVAAVKEVRAESAFMKNRPATINRELHEISQRIGLNQNQFEIRLDAITRKVFRDTRTYGDVQRGFFSMIGAMQSVVDTVAYIGARDQAIAEGKHEATARAIGEQQVRDTQASGESAYQPEVLRGNAYKKLFTTFFGPMLATFNLWTEAMHRARRERSRGDVLRSSADLAGTYALLFIAGPAMITLLRELAKGDLGDDDDLERFLWEWVQGQTGTIFLVRDVGQAVAGGFGYEGPPGMRPVATAAETTKRVGRAWRDEDYTAIVSEAARGGVSIGGALLHLPTGAGNRAWRAYDAWINGELEVNPVRAALFGFDREGYQP